MIYHPFMQRFLILISILMVTHAVASPTEAERIKRGFELSQESFALKMKIATTPAEKQEVWDKRPSAEAAASQIWKIIARSIHEDWSIPYAAFYLNLTHGWVASDKEIAKNRQLIMDSFEERHLEKPNIGEFCIALTQSGSPRALPLLEKIISKNPNKKIQGVAALGAALLLKNLGDAPKILEKRITHLRMAIIEAADEKIGSLSVAKVAEDELFIILYLIKGRTPPEFSGTDVAGRIIRSADFKGKITILLFWDTKSPEIDKVIQLTNQLVNKYTAQSISIIGITPEPLGRVRELQANETIRWNNIIDSKDEIAGLYRIRNRPSVFILDAKGKLEYSGVPGSFVELTIDALLEGPKKEK
jgi:peroxiredoxin